jgi:hypothetical protein
MRNCYVLGLFLIIGCSKSKVPKDLLPPDKMQAVYWDYLRADVFANEYVRRDTSLNVVIESARLQNQVFQLHKTNRKQFYTSYEYYLQTPERMKAMLDTIIHKQQVTTRMQDSLRSKTKTNLQLRDTIKLKDE